MGDTDQFRVSKLDTRARFFVPVIKQYFNTETLGQLINILRHCADEFGFMCIYLYDNELKRSNIFWPNDAVLVMILFDAGGDDSGYTNAVTTHRHNHTFAVFI